MTKIYDDLEDSLLGQFNSSTKQSLEDIALDEEEKNKIIFNISGTTEARIPDLRVDYSDFENHIFFASAESAAKFARNRILEYPVDGELKDINAWKDLNTGYENWFFDNFPKDTGHIFLTSGSNGPSIKATDFEEKINFGTGSFTFEFIGDLYEDIPDNTKYPIVSILSDAQTIEHSILFYLSKSAGVKNLHLQLISASSTQQATAQVDSFLSSSRHFAVVYNRPDVSFYVDGDKIASSSLSGPATGSYEMGVKNIGIGYFQSSSIDYFASASFDDVRIWATARPEDLIKRNSKRTVYANHSSSLGLYAKFNENWLTASSDIINYAGNEIEIKPSGSFSFASNYLSGPLGELNDLGDPILDFTNETVDSFLTDQINSGSIFDAKNNNYIFELVPSFLVDEQNSDETRKFLLLIARHWDRLKLYIQHLSNIYSTTVASSDDTPPDYLNFVARHYGIDIGGIYEGSDPLQYFYGDNVFSTASLDSPIKTVRNQIKRNVVNNLIYFYKAKSTKEAIKAALRSIGLNDDIVNVNQYSILSGGLETKYEQKTVEKRTLNFDGTLGQYITIHSSSYSTDTPRTYQFRFNLISGSYTGSAAPQTASLFRLETSNSSSNVMEAEVWRLSPSSSRGKLAVYHSASADSPLISNSFEVFENNWINLSLFRDEVNASNLFGFNVSSLNRDEIEFHFSGSGTLNNAYNPATASPRIGSVADKELYANYQEVRVWNKILTSSAILEKHTKDFESLALENFYKEINDNKLSVHLKLNDKTGSSSGNGPLHDYVDAKSGSSYTNFSASANYNFPGQFINKLEPSYSYDFNIDNDKVRIKEDSIFNKNDITEDIQFVSIDFSPVSALNKEIIKWFGDIEQFNNIIGFPYLKYRDEITELNSYRSKFFLERVNSTGIDFEAYLDIIKWFDSNFVYFLSQLIPFELASSLSNFVVEPHIFEFNKVKNIFPYTDSKSSRLLSASVTTSPILTGTNPVSLSIGDPGRFGAFGSASALVENDTIINYSGSLSSSNSINFGNFRERKILLEFLSGNRDGTAVENHGNGFHLEHISCSNYEYNVLNANNDFGVSKIHFVGDSVNSSYLTSSQGAAANTFFSKSTTGILDARWEYYQGTGPKYDFGLGYGGAIGQLWDFSNKSKFGGDLLLVGGEGIGLATTWDLASPNSWIRTAIEEEANKKTVILWPTKDAYNGVNVVALEDGNTTGSIAGQDASFFGETINIENYTNLNVEIIGRSSQMETRSLKFIINFQFFDQETGDSGFESILSSSYAGSSYKTSMVPHSYEFDVDFDLGLSGQYINESFLTTFERELPRSRYMRIKLTAIVEGSQGAKSTPGGEYNFLVKGILSKTEESKDILKVR